MKITFKTVKSNKSNQKINFNTPIFKTFLNQRNKKIATNRRVYFSYTSTLSLKLQHTVFSSEGRREV